MLGRQNRLTGKEINLFKTKRSESSDLFNIKTLDNNKSALTVIISKKHIKSSVKRHLLKRRICYAYSQFLKKQNKSFAVYTKKPLNTVPDYKTITKNICGTP